MTRTTIDFLSGEASRETGYPPATPSFQGSASLRPSRRVNLSPATSVKPPGYPKKGLARALSGKVPISCHQYPVTHALRPQAEASAGPSTKADGGRGCLESVSLVQLQKHFQDSSLITQPGKVRTSLAPCYSVCGPSAAKAAAPGS